MQTWLDMFQATITCPSCREHFETAVRAYRGHYPSMLNSRKDFLLFTFRVHNSVNRRINKILYPTVAECFSALQLNVKTRSAREYRKAYLSHIQRFWRTMQDVNGMVASKKIIEMVKIEVDYFQKRDNNFEVVIDEDSVLLHPAVMNRSEPSEIPQFHIEQQTLPRPVFFGGRFRFRR